MKNWIFTFLIACCTIVLFAKHSVAGGNIKGVLTDTSKESIPGVIVFLEHTAYTMHRPNFEETKPGLG